MLARLILALLLAAFAVPAAASAACHEAAVSGVHAMAMDHQMPTREHEAVVPHGCIGCIPPSTWIAAPVVPVVSHAAALLIQRAIVLDIGTSAPPALPPPRGA